MDPAGVDDEVVLYRKKRDREREREREKKKRISLCFSVVNNNHVFHASWHTLDNQVQFTAVKFVKLAHHVTLSPFVKHH